MRCRLEAVRGGRLLVAGASPLFALIPLVLTATGAIGAQVMAAGIGALMAIGGVALVHGAWPRRRVSDLHHLLVAFGFFLLCAGVVGMLAGVGLYH